jgi:hypothetical protein
MTHSSPEQRAEAARLLALRADDDIWWPSYEEWGDLLPDLLPALLADAEALAERERAGKYASPTPTPADVEAGRAVWTERGWRWKMTDAVIISLRMTLPFRPE